MKKALTGLVIAVAVFAALAMSYGIYRFPDAPIRQCGENCFAGKQGRQRTREDYDAFNRWLVVTPASIVLAIALGFVSLYIERSERSSS